MMMVHFLIILSPLLYSVCFVDKPIERNNFDFCLVPVMITYLLLALSNFGWYLIVFAILLFGHWGLCKGWTGMVSCQSHYFWGCKTNGF